MLAVSGDVGVSAVMGYSTGLEWKPPLVLSKGGNVLAVAWSARPVQGRANCGLGGTHLEFRLRARLPLSASRITAVSGNFGGPDRGRYARRSWPGARKANPACYTVP